jgi:hypothetical protein
LEMQVDEDWRVVFQSWKLGPRLLLDYGSSWVPVGALLFLAQRQKAARWSPPPVIWGGGGWKLSLPAGKGSDEGP